MNKEPSDKGSRGSFKKEGSGEPVSLQKEDVESLARKEFDENDEEEEEGEPVPPLTSSSSDNMYKILAMDSETSRVLDIDTAEAAMTKIQGSAHEGTGTSISSQIKKIIARELSTPSKSRRIDLQSVPLKEYLEQTVIPIVHQGLLAVARERPNSPIEYLAAYFLKHKHRYQTDQQTLYNMEQDKTYETASSGNATQANTVAEQSLPGTNEVAPMQT